MTVREQTEKNEHILFSEYAAFSDSSRGRSKPCEKCPLRTEYQRDRDRIIHSKAFRRLKHKTQVFLAPEGDHYRTRLTHTLEVAQIARTIARSLRLNEDLTEAIALGHDLGHTPFGHAGERALNDVSSTGFRHYEQSVRVADILENDGAGLNLTYEVRNGIVCHTKGTEAFTGEGRIVRLADKIAYINHDIDDAVRAGVLTEQRLPPELTAVLGHSKSERINKLVMSVAENSRGIEIKPSSEMSKAFSQMSDYIFEHLYRNPTAKSEEGKAEVLIKRLFGYFTENSDKLPGEYLDIRNTEGAERAAMDYIAGMSDRYAVKIYNELFIPKGWTVVS